MALDYVPDDRRVLAGIDLWLSRFGRAPSVRELQRLTGLTESRVSAALVVVTERVVKAARARAAAEPHPLPRPRVVSRKAPTETLVCTECGSPWERATTRGAKPRRCPPCRLG
jgi:hypothetical protein